VANFPGFFTYEPKFETRRTQMIQQLVNKVRTADNNSRLTSERQNSNHGSMAKKQTPKFDPQWAKAKNVCRLNVEDIRMAKALGMSPRGLMKNIPSPTQRWKRPVKYWIRELYEKRFGRETGPASKSSRPCTHAGAAGTETFDVNIPF